MAVTSTPPVLAVRDIRKRFGATEALAGVSLEIRRGEVHALVGANGAGKSTLIKVITGAISPDEGEIEVRDDAGPETYARLTPVSAAHLGVTAIHQEFHLLPDLSVAENIFLGRLPVDARGLIQRSAMREQAVELLGRLGSDIDPRRPVRTLSVAGQQLVEIAKALAARARVLLMDEPSAVLGGASLDQLLDAVRRLRDAGTGLVYISHRTEEVYEIADRVTILRDGATVDCRPTGQLPRQELIRLMAGKPVREQFPDRAAELGEPALVVRGLGTRNGALRDLDLSVRAGEILGLGGMVGSGRTRLLRSIMGLEQLAGGTVECGGAKVDPHPRAAIRAGLALVPEDRKLQGLFLPKSVGFNVSLSSLAEVARAGLIDGGAERALVARLFERLNVKAEGQDTLVGRLSGGNQQKVLLARWLATSPRVLLVDEPTRGIDLATKGEIYRLMRELTEAGMGIVMVSSEMPELMGMSDRILVMRDGEIVAELSSGEGFSDESILAFATGEGA